ncbi:ABC transporter permease [Falsirhodobacter sp. 20TX0035]|uniref:ABC transporter permease n=1 Tax=Falsirhodobacter sp. 20TX0035 TaxID=3022019 RepID=UPI0023302203|nr:iron ABC transporter permease [Falsirhodobacter sp. 20TX0035]MDB6454431.1 iron ABC transporter permease [Falsirhodobacter sp. 20TX0035]
MLAALVVVYVTVIGLWPLARLFLTAFAPGDEGQVLGLMRDTLDSRATGRALWNTLEAGGGSVLISVLLGVALALLIGALNLRARVAMTFLILSPLLVPSQIMALAWIELLGSSSPILGPLGLAPEGTNPLYSGGGIAFLMGIEHMPLVFIATRAALTSIPNDLVEAARIAGARNAAILMRVILPLCLPAIAAGGTLAFAAAIGNFGVPALLGIPGRYSMLTTLIYQRLNGFGPSVMGQVAVLALILVAMAGVALALRAVVMRLAVPVPGGRSFARFDAGRARGPIEAGLWIFLAVTMVLPILALLGTALSPALGVDLSFSTVTLGNFAETLGNGTIRRALMNSLWLSFAAAAISMIVAVPFVWLSHVARLRSMRVMDVLADLPFIVPGTVLALAMILVFLPPLPGIGSIYGTPMILLVAYLARFLPLVLRPVAATATQAEPALDEAARIFNAPTWARITLIFAPMVTPAALAGAVLVVMTAINELTLSSLLWSSGSETVGVMIFSLQYEGNSTSAAALSTVSLLLVFALVVVADRFGRHAPDALPWR